MLNFQDRMGKVQKEFKVGTCENFITNLYFKMTTYIYIKKLFMFMHKRPDVRHPHLHPYSWNPSKAKVKWHCLIWVLNSPSQVVEETPVYL